MANRRTIWVIALFAVLVAACGIEAEGAGDDTTSTQTPSSAESAAPAPSTSMEPADETAAPADPGDATPEPDPGAPLPEQPSPKVPRALETFATAAVADLAARLAVAESDITVAVAEFVVWPDGSLGCPQPGMVYTQVQVDGSRVVLVHGQDTYHYHSGGNRPDPFLCENLET